MIAANLEVTENEELYSRNIDKFIHSKGLKPIRWAYCTFVLTLIYTVLVLVSSIHRADSLNVTVCSLGIYLLINTENVKKSSFRLLVAALIVSLCYDVAWSLLKDSSEGQFEDKNAPHWIIEISKWVQWLLIGFKVVLIFVFWKASIDFAALIDERKMLFY